MNLSSIRGILFILTSCLVTIFTFLVICTVADHFNLFEANATPERLRSGTHAVAALVLIVLSIAWFIVRRILKSLSALVEHVNSFPQLHGDERFSHTSSTDEVGLLAKGFNRIVAEMDRQQELARSLLENTSTPLFVIGTNHEVLIWNRAMAALTGIESREMVGTSKHWQPFYSERFPTLADMLADGEVETVASRYAKVSYEPDSVTARVEDCFRSLNGRDRYVYCDATPILDEHGSLVAVVESIHDMTERKELETRLRKQQAELLVKHEELKALFQQVEVAKQEWEKTMDCIDDILVIIDRDNRVRRCNRGFVDILGKEYRSVIGAEWHELFARFRGDNGSDLNHVPELFHEKSGRWFGIKIYSFAEGSRKVIAMHDLTEIKQVTSELENAYAELKATHVQMLHHEKMASIGQLAAGVAHEINNPMGFISSNLGTLGKYLERLRAFVDFQSESILPGAMDEILSARKRLKIDYLLDDIPNLLQESSDGAERVRMIVQNLKSFSRVDEQEMKEANLIECLESTVSIAWNELKYKCTVEKDYGEIPPVKCYPQQLNQVFLNLLVNGAQSIEAQGVIRISTWQEGGDVCVAIGDTGCGIPDGLKNRIFEPFFTTKEIGKGTGLGLSISYDIIRKHGGSIELHSVVGQGSTFTVHLPVAGFPAEEGNNGVMAEGQAP